MSVQVTVPVWLMIQRKSVQAQVRSMQSNFSQGNHLQGCGDTEKTHHAEMVQFKIVLHLVKRKKNYTSKAKEEE